MADAIIAAAGVNATHGLKRKKGDLEKAILMLLEVDRIRFMENKYKLNRDEIMKVTNCSRQTFQNVTAALRKDLKIARELDIVKLDGEGVSQREIAKRVGVVLSTVQSILGDRKRHDGKIGHSENEQQEVSSEENAEEAPEEQPSVFAHITEAKVAECPWDDVEEDVEVQEEATGPSFSETNAQARIRLFIEDLSEEDKAYALKLLAV